MFQVIICWWENPKEREQNKEWSIHGETDKKLADCFCKTIFVIYLPFLFPAIRTTFYPKIWFSNWWNWSIKDTCSLLALQSDEKKNMLRARCGFSNSCLSISRTFYSRVDPSWSCLSVCSVQRATLVIPCWMRVQRVGTFFLHHSHTMLTHTIQTKPIHTQKHTHGLQRDGNFMTKQKFRTITPHGCSNVQASIY